MALEDIARELGTRLVFTGTAYSPSPRMFNWHIWLENVCLDQYGIGEVDSVIGEGRNSLDQARKNLVRQIKGKKVYVMRYNGERVQQTLIREYNVPANLTA